MNQPAPFLNVEYFFRQLYLLLTSGSDSSGLVAYLFSTILPAVHVIFIVISLALIFLFIYIETLIHEVRHTEKEVLYPSARAHAAAEAEEHGVLAEDHEVVHDDPADHLASDHATGAVAEPPLVYGAEMPANLPTGAFHLEYGEFPPELAYSESAAQAKSMNVGATAGATRSLSVSPALAAAGTAPRAGEKKWRSILAHSSSGSPSDWRIAILEADIMLDDLLRSRGYERGSLGERLKEIARGDLRTIDDAWEAHKMRNLIAHEGGNFTLTERDVRQTMQRFRNVFEEFQYI